MVAKRADPRQVWIEADFVGKVARSRQPM